MANTKVTTGVIKDDAVGADQLASNSVVTASIVDNAITTAKINNDAILTAKISNSAVTNAKLAANSVDSDQYVDGSIDTAHIADGQITSAKLDTNISVSGELTVGSHLNMGDGDILKMGAGDDLQIYHDGSNSYITDTGTGNLLIRASNELALTSAGGDAYFLGINGGASYLYYAGAVKLQTTSSGVDVTGTVTADNAEIGTGGSSDGNALIDLTGDTTYTDFGFRIIRNSGANGNTDLRHRGTGNLNIEAVEAGNIVFETSDIPRVTIDSSGAVGIGVVPQTNRFAGHNVLQIGARGTLLANDTGSSTGQTAILDNLFYNSAGSFRVRDGSNATAGVAMQFVEGNTIFSNSAATTGDPTVIERMRVSSDGDIRINTTGQMGNATLTVKAYTNTNTGLMLQEYDTSNAYGLYTVTSDDSFRITRFVSGAYSDRLIIDSNGSFGINTSSLSTESSLFIGKQPSAGNQEGGQLVLQSSVNGSKAIHIDNYNNASTDFCRFMRGTDTNSEAVLGVWDITNTRFGIGTATPAQTLTVAGSAWATGYYITALQGNAQLTNASTSSGSNPSYIGQGLISVTVSDAKAKENFGSVETNECLNKIVSLSEHVKKFDWIDEDWKREKGRTVGMVAQEIYEDHSEFVHKPENYDDNGWAIRYQEIVPTLIKAIQEQQTIIENLQSRLDEAGL